MKYEIVLEFIKTPYLEDPLKLVLPFSMFAMLVSLWSVGWRVWDKDKEFKNAEFAQNELRFSNAVNLLSKKEDPVFFSEGIRELARLRRERKINSERIDQLTSSKLTIEKGSFSNADLRGINLAYADLDQADLKNANLENANLENADFTGAKLENANLEYANLENAKFIGANLTNAKLENTNHEKADFTDANLKGTILENKQP